MRALSYHGPGRTAWEPVADPEITHDLDAVSSMPTLLRLLAGRQIEAGRFVTHHFALE